MNTSGTRHKDCIICGARTGTGEHVFPSALGGRRENKSIYCPSHNHWMGAHVAVLQQQLAMINAMLGIKPDRGHASPFLTTAQDGRRYAFHGADIRWNPDLDELLNSLRVDQPQNVRLAAGQINHFKKLAKDRGLDIDVTGPVTRSKEYHLDAVRVRLELGGEPGMRAVAYLALTFFAHHWPELARKPGLQDVKQVLRSGSIYAGEDRIESSHPINMFVAWAAPLSDPPEVVPPTVFWHTIIICISDGLAVAYVSLFSLLCFKVLLGATGEGISDRSVVVHIDPLAEHFGRDWTSHHFSRALIDSSVNDAYLEEAVLGSDAMARRVSTVYRAILERQDRAEAELAAREYLAACLCQSPEREAALRAFVEVRSQRLVNLLLRIAAQNGDSNPVADLLQRTAARLTQRDPTSVDGLNAAGRRALDALISDVTDYLAKTSHNQTLHADEFFSVFRGEVGLGLAIGVLLQEMRDELMSDGDPTQI